MYYILYMNDIITNVYIYIYIICTYYIYIKVRRRRHLTIGFLLYYNLISFIYIICFLFFFFSKLDKMNIHGCANFTRRRGHVSYSSGVMRARTLFTTATTTYNRYYILNTHYIYLLTTAAAVKPRVNA